MQEGVKIVLSISTVPRFCQETHLERRFESFALGQELVGVGPTTADDDNSSVREDGVGGVPPTARQGRAHLGPVAAVGDGGGAGAEGTYDAFAVAVTAGLDEVAGGVDGSGRAEGVGEDGEGSEGVGSDII